MDEWLNDLMTGTIDEYNDDPRWEDTFWWALLWASIFGMLCFLLSTMILVPFIK